MPSEVYWIKRRQSVECNRASKRHTGDVTTGVGVEIVLPAGCEGWCNDDKSSLCLHTIELVFVSEWRSEVVENGVSGCRIKARPSSSEDGWLVIVECVGVDKFGVRNHFSLYSSIFIDFLVDWRSGCTQFSYIVGWLCRAGGMGIDRGEEDIVS